MYIWHGQNGNPSQKLVRNLSFMIAVAIVALVLVNIKGANAKTSCRPVYDPRWPGLTECTARVTVKTIVAMPPEPQKRSLWCWAASLSMIYTHQGHPVSQENIVLQNFGRLIDAPGGDFLTFERRLNRQYKDDRGNVFTSSATRIRTPADAAEALDNDIPILYTTSHHATVQTALTYHQVPNGPVAFRGGWLWDPAPGTGRRQLSEYDVKNFVAAWSIETE